MFRKFGICLALVSAIATSQLPLGMFQVCSLVGMFSDYVVETGSVEKSLDLTFDGEHPCDGCNFVSAQIAKSDGQQKTSFTGVTYFKLLLATLVVEIPVLKSPPVIGETNTDTPLLFSEVANPVTPPPRRTIATI